MKKKSFLKRLFLFAGNYKYLTIAGMVLSAISAVMSILPTLFIWYGIKELFFIYPNITMSDKLIYYLIFALISGVGAMIIYFIALLFTHLAAFRIAKNMKISTLTHLINLPLGYFNDNSSGKLRRTINDCASQTEIYLSHQLPDITGAIATPIAILGVLFLVDWRLGIISILSLLMAAISQFLLIGKGYKERMRDFQTSLENMNNEAIEYVRGISVIKTFGHTIFSFKKLYNTIDIFKKVVIDYSLFSRIPTTLFLTFLGSTSIFLIISGILIFPGESSFSLFFINMLFYLLFTPVFTLMVGRIMWTSQNTLLAEDALDRIEELMSAKPMQHGENKLFPEKHNISIEKISFSYPNSDKEIISELSLEIDEGSTVAIVGVSGGGKSTLASLLVRFWDITKGSIKIGGVEIKDIDEKELFSNISFVFQNTNLYKSSILDNVRESSPDATEEEVLKALKDACCEDIINKLPNGIHTKVGINGIFLSGGETQRIAIARAILKNAPIVLLDEATAFADPENEYKIQLALGELIKNKTVLIIAHRLSTIQNVDKIHLMANGKIIESGTHIELLKQHGEYAGMWNEYQKALLWR